MVQVEGGWHDDGGSLRGWVAVVNDDASVLRLHGKPSISPLAADGTSLDVRHVITLEMRCPGCVDLLPGQRARAPITWGGWDGPEAGHEVLVGWYQADGEGGSGSRVQTRVAVLGPHQPTGTVGGTNTSSSWFELLT